MSELGQFAFFMASGAVGITLLVMLKPVFHALATRIGGGVLPDDLEARLQALEARTPVTGETDAVYHRVEELEARLEFTERMLAQAREGQALPQGKE